MREVIKDWIADVIPAIQSTIRPLLPLGGGWFFCTD